MATKVVRKWFWVWEFEKEEAWLADMVKQGWVLDDVGFCRYRFISCEPGEYAVRLELLEDLPQSEKGMDYINFIEETGAKFVGSYFRWAYFRKKCEDGAFDLFSDIASRIRHIDRIMKMVGTVGAANILIGLAQINRFGIVNLLCAALLGYCCYRLHAKKKKLEKERVLHE